MVSCSHHRVTPLLRFLSVAGRDGGREGGDGDSEGWIEGVTKGKDGKEHQSQC